jgi:hypothetical protein
VPEARRQALAALLPGLSGLGLKPAGAPAFYSNNLWEYIDGAAEAFHSYDFEALIHAVYEAGPAEVTVDVYDMGDGLNAFGIYSAERSPDYAFLPVGAQGYGDAFSFFFLDGPYYVKLSAYAEGTPDSTLLVRVAERLAEAASGPGGVPAVFGSFPEAGAVPNTERFTKKSAMGHAFLGSAYERQYGAGGETVTLLLSPAESPEAAAERLARLRAHFAQNGTAADAAGFGPGAFRGSNDYEGTVTATVAGSALILQAGTSTAPTDPLEALAARLSGKP